MLIAVTSLLQTGRVLLKLYLIPLWLLLHRILSASSPSEEVLGHQERKPLGHQESVHLKENKKTTVCRSVCH